MWGFNSLCCMLLCCVIFHCCIIFYYIMGYYIPLYYMFLLLLTPPFRGDTFFRSLSQMKVFNSTPQFRHWISSMRNNNYIISLCVMVHVTYMLLYRTLLDLIILLHKVYHTTNMFTNTNINTNNKLLWLLILMWMSH